MTLSLPVSKPDTREITVKVINVSKSSVLADNAKIAGSFLTRLVGLLNRSCLNKGEALILSPSNSIHTFFMRFAIDVIFLDRNSRVTRKLPSLKPWRFSGVYLNAKSVVELPPGIIESTSTQEGDTISIL